MDVAGDPPALGDGARQHRELVAQQDDVGDPLVIWLPEPIATASRACFSAGTSLTPSPIIAVKRPRSASAPTSAFFCSGVIRQKIVFCSAACAEPAVVVWQLRPLDHAGVAGHPDGVGHRGHGLACVAGDQLQVDLLVAA